MKPVVLVFSTLVLTACSADSDLYIPELGPQRTQSFDVNSILTTRPHSTDTRRLALSVTDTSGIEMLDNGDFSNNPGAWITCSNLLPGFGTTSAGQAALVKGGDCIQQGVSLAEVAPNTELQLSCDAALTEGDAYNWTGIGMSFYDASWNFISEPDAALVTGREFSQYDVIASTPSQASYVGVWIYSEYGAAVSQCSLKRPDDGPTEPNFDNVLLNADFSAVNNGTPDNWINYCGGYSNPVQPAGSSAVALGGGACVTQSLNNTQLTALRGQNFLLQCNITNPDQGYAELNTNLTGIAKSQVIQTSGEQRVVSLSGTVPVDLGNAYVSIYKEGTTSELTAYNYDLRRNDNPAQNQPPVANDDTRTYPAITGGSFSTNTIDIAANDFDPEGALDFNSITITRPPSFGTLFESTVDYFTTIGRNDSFSYTIRDQQGAVSNEATVYINFENIDVNQPPVTIDDQFFVAPGASRVLAVLGNDSDPDNDPLQVRIGLQPQFGTVSVDGNNRIVYTHDGSNSITDSFTYAAFDGALAQPATVFISIGNGYLGGLEGRAVDPQDVQSPAGYDFRRAGMVRTPTGQLRAIWEMYNPIDNGSYQFSIYIDVDRDSNTGFRGFNNEYEIGVDYLVEGNYQYKYTGNVGNDWSWQLAANVGTGSIDQIGTLSLPLESVFDERIRGIRYFYRGDNESIGAANDYYPDGANDPTATFRFYNFTWISPEVSANAALDGSFQ